MYEELKSRLASMLARTRDLKPQSERQLASHLAEHSSSTAGFLLCASEVLEDYELDIVFGPVFTPTIDERAELADLLFHWRPTEQDLTRLVKELLILVPHAMLNLPDGTQARLTLHEVMIERFVRLLRLDSAPDPAIAAALRDTLPAELWPIALALLCERGMTPEHQRWFVAFVNHMAGRRTVSRELLTTAAEFFAGQKKLDQPTMLSAAEALVRATRGTAAYAAGGHAYWSPDVAQHHHYRGQGRVDQEQIEQHQAELERVESLVEDLKTFEG